MKSPDADWPHICYTSYPWIEVCAWCEQNIGKFDREWYKLGEDIAAQGFDPGYRSTYIFRDERHAVLFQLRWS
jgi:hypothetical protein